MRPVTTAVLFGVVLVLGIFTLLTGRRPATPGAASPDTGANVLTSFDPAGIDTLVIRRPNGEARLEKRDGQWRLDKPVADRASNKAAGSLLDLLSHLTILDQISKSDVGSTEELSPDQLGLNAEKVIRVELGASAKKGTSTVLLIGHVTPLDNTVYARVPDSGERPNVYVVDGNPHPYLDDPVEALRDPGLVARPAERIVQVNIQTPKGTIEVKRKITPPAYDWNLVRPLQTRANRELLENILVGVSTLQYDKVLESGELPPAPPNPIPDGHIALELYSFGESEPLTIYLSPGKEKDEGKGAPQLRATVGDRPAVFSVRSDLLSVIPDSPNAYRDPHLARIPMQNVFGIAINSRDNPPVVLKTARAADGVRWYSLRNGEEEPANLRRVFTLIQGVNEQKVLDFVSDSAARLADYGLDPPALRIAFSLYEVLPDSPAPDGNPSPDAGKVGITKKVLQLGTNDEEILYANFSGEPYVYALSPAFRNLAPPSPLKWKGLKVLSFSSSSLRTVHRTGSNSPDLDLRYDWQYDTWTGTSGGENISGQIDRNLARKMRDTLASLEAVDWITELATAYKELETPSAVIRLSVEVLDKATGMRKPEEHTLQFAPAGGSLFYGKLDDSPDIFLIDRETYGALIAPLANKPIRPPG